MMTAEETTALRLKLLAVLRPLVGAPFANFAALAAHLAELTPEMLVLVGKLLIESSGGSLPGFSRSTPIPTGAALRLHLVELGLKDGRSLPYEHFSQKRIHDAAVFIETGNVVEENPPASSAGTKIVPTPADAPPLTPHPTPSDGSGFEAETLASEWRMALAEMLWETCPYRFDFGGKQWPLVSEVARDPKYRTYWRFLAAMVATLTGFAEGHVRSAGVMIRNAQREAANGAVPTGT